MTQAQAITSYSARDEFNQSSGAATGKTLPVGGTWGGAGDADDFTIGSGLLQRAATSDSSGVRNGRLLTASGTSSMTATVVSATLTPMDYAGARLGLLARYVDASNFLTAYWEQSVLYVVKVVAGTATTLASVAAPYVATTTRLEVGVGGSFTASFGTVEVKGYDAVLAAGGTLATGKVGAVDHNTSALAYPRYVDDFVAYVLIEDAAIFANQSLEIKHNQARREDSAGVQLQPVSGFYGDYLRIPVSGLEARPVRIIVKASRGVPLEGSDSATDDISARLYYTPRYLVVPE